MIVKAVIWKINGLSFHRLSLVTMKYMVCVSDAASQDQVRAEGPGDWGQAPTHTEAEREIVLVFISISIFHIRTRACKA